MCLEISRIACTYTFCILSLQQRLDTLTLLAGSHLTCKNIVSEMTSSERVECDSDVS